MNKTILFLFALIGFLLLDACSEQEALIQVAEPIETMQSRSSLPAYDYPVRPGSDEWLELKTHDEKLRVTQLPDDILKNLSTEDLLDVCMDYPLLVDAFLFNSFEEGLDKMCSRFNGFQEFMRRDDNAEVLSKYLERKSQSVKLANADKSTSRLDLATEVAIGLLQKESIRMNLSANASSVAEAAINILAANGLFSERMHSSSDNVVKASTSTAYTPLGSSWRIASLLELSEKDKNDIRNHIVSTYPRAIILGEATTTYNCHAYAWYMREGNSKKIWLNPDGVSAMGTLRLPPVEDGSYTRTNTAPGRKIVYYDNTGAAHSGVVYANTGWVVSKWGAWCLMRHMISDCPYDSHDVRYYKSNLKISGPTSLERKGQYVEADYSVTGGSSAGSASMTTTSAAQIIGQLNQGGIRVRASNNFSVSATFTMNGTMFNVPSVDVEVWNNLRIAEVSTFQYGQSGYEHTIRVKYEGSDEAYGVWSCSDPGVTISDVMYPGDAMFMEPNCFYKAVSFSGPGIYTLDVYPMSNDAVGAVVTITIDATSGEVQFRQLFAPRKETSEDSIIE